MKTDAQAVRAGRLEQRAIHGEMRMRQEAVGIRDLGDFQRERVGDVASTRRSRSFENTVGAQAASFAFCSTNQRNAVFHRWEAEQGGLLRIRSTHAARLHEGRAPILNAPGERHSNRATSAAPC